VAHLAKYRFAEYGVRRYAFYHNALKMTREVSQCLSEHVLIAVLTFLNIKYFILGQASSSLYLTGNHYKSQSIGTETIHFPS